MKIIVLNGSPKGDESITLQYARYLAKIYPQHTFETVNIAQRIKRIENDAATFDGILEQVRGADGVLWAFPLYFLLVHAHLKRFIELIFERGAQDAFADKYTAALSTSIHYFDHTAHNYIHAVCDDLGMRFVESFSPDMEDLMREEGRRQLVQFGGHFFDAIQNQSPTQRRYPALNGRKFEYMPTMSTTRAAAQGKKVLILHDAKDAQSNLAKMVAHCQSAFDGDVSVVNLNEVEIQSSCLGCLHCGADYQCVFEGKDEFIDFFREQVMKADILVFAGEIHDRYLSARWKSVFDRSFFNTHTPVLANKQLAFLISGPLSQIQNLYEIFQGYAEFQQANLVGFVSDECGSSSDIDAMIDGLTARCADFARESYARPNTFLGVGGMKLFRDDIWGRLRFVFPADYRAFGRIGLYKTFPQADLKMRATNSVMLPILSIAKINKGFRSQVKAQMVAPMKAVVEKS